MPFKLAPIGSFQRLCAARAYHTTPIARFPYKDSQDRESLKPQTAEHTKSGRDDDAAAAGKAAFDRGITTPEGARDAAAEERGSDPLEVSGANEGLSKPRGDERSKNDRGAGKEVRKGGRSGAGGASKNG